MKWIPCHKEVLIYRPEARTYVNEDVVGLVLGRRLVKCIP